MELKTAFIHNINYRVRQVGKQSLLFGNGEAFEINEVGLAIWDYIDGENDVGTIIHKINDLYDADPTVIKKDVLNFIDFLKGIDALEDVN